MARNDENLKMLSTSWMSLSVAHLIVVPSSYCWIGERWKWLCSGEIWCSYCVFLDSNWLRCFWKCSFVNDKWKQTLFEAWVEAMTTNIQASKGDSCRQATEHARSMLPVVMHWLLIRSWKLMEFSHTFNWHSPCHLNHLARPLWSIKNTLICTLGLHQTMKHPTTVCHHVLCL